jgi:thioredoxin reductase
VEGPHENVGDSAASRWDVIIVGAGPAGLSAALVLGRCCRKVLICDRGTPRSWASKAMHGYLSRDGIAPEAFRVLSLRELATYPSVSYRLVEVEKVFRTETGFLVEVGEHLCFARKLLIATGVMDRLPPLDGIETLFGISVFQCPYCDGWEFRDRPVAVYGQQTRGLEMARALTSWTRDIVLCTHGPSGFTDQQRQDLAVNKIRLIERKIKTLNSRDNRLQSITFDDGRQIEREAIFFDTPSDGQSNLTQQLGCRFTRKGGILCGKYEATSVPGVYVAGNIIRNVQLSIVAAGEGANAAFGINRALTREDYEARATGHHGIEHTAPQTGQCEE